RPRLDARPGVARLPRPRARAAAGAAVSRRLRAVRAADHALRRVPRSRPPRLAASLLPPAALARAPPLRRRARGLAPGSVLARLDAVVRRRRRQGAQPPLRRAAARRLRTLGATAPALLPLRDQHDR